MDILSEHVEKECVGWVRLRFRDVRGDARASLYVIDSLAKINFPLIITTQGASGYNSSIQPPELTPKASYI